MPKARRDTLMTEIRKSRGLSLAAVAEVVGTDAGNLSRIESGAQPPKRDLARKLHEFYGGAVPLAAIHDPAYAEPHVAARKA